MAHVTKQCTPLVTAPLSRRNQGRATLHRGYPNRNANSNLERRRSSHSAADRDRPLDRSHPGLLRVRDLGQQFDLTDAINLRPTQPKHVHCAVVILGIDDDEAIRPAKSPRQFFLNERSGEVRTDRNMRFAIEMDVSQLVLVHVKISPGHRSLRANLPMRLRDNSRQRHNAISHALCQRA